MILPDFVIPSRINQRWMTSGIDSEEQCIDLKHYRSYPYHVEYHYNNRGYRDEPWPNSLTDLQQSVWCLGDSFTVGIGSPRQHTWSYILQQTLNQRTINVSMDGASNNWIARKAVRVLEQIKPRLMILHWSYIHRREKDPETAMDDLWKRFYNDIRDPSWPQCSRQERDQLPKYIKQEIHDQHSGWDDFETPPDDCRIEPYSKCSNEEDIVNTLNCIGMINQLVTETQVIHSFIPKFVPKSYAGTIESKISGLVIPEICILDLARDGHHYDLLTAEKFSADVCNLLANSGS